MGEITVRVKDKITPELNLLLACVKQEGHRFRTLADAHPADWQYFLALTRHHRLFPLVHEFVTTKENIDIPAFVRESLKIQMIEYSFRDEEIKAALKKCALILNGRGISYCLLKGPVLGQRLYGNSALRPSKDLDILVEQENIADVIVWLRELGFEVEKNYRKLKGAEWEAVFKREHHLKLFDEKILIELHWRLMSSKHPVFAGFETKTLLERAIRREFEGIAVFTLSPEDELVYLVTHGSVHYWFRLRWLHDIVLYLEKFPGLNFDVVKESFARNGMMQSFYQALLLIRYLYGEDKVRRLYRPEEITSGSRRLFELTFSYLNSTRDMLEYHPFTGGYYKKILYVFWLLPHNKSRLQYLKYQFSIPSGEAVPRLFTHFRRVFKKERASRGDML